MLSLEFMVAGSMMVVLTFYVLMAGADYGGGVWDLFAPRERAKSHRDLIADSIGPIWESNHVWLIIVVVILFTAFPLAFSILATNLHIAITLALIGIVLRGSAFTFRTYDSGNDEVQLRWGKVFSISSCITPILLGAVIGAISSGKVRTSAGDFYSVFIAPWLAPFPIAVGFLALTLFALLAAVYLILESDDKQLQEDFRRRALITAFLAGVMAFVVFILAKHGAPLVWQVLTGSFLTWPLHIVTAIVSTGGIVALWVRRYALARTFVMIQVALILWGWGFAQYPYLVQPDITIYDSAAPAATLRMLLSALVSGAVILVPSILYLLKVFKGPEQRYHSVEDHD